MKRTPQLGIATLAILTCVAAVLLFAASSEHGRVAPEEGLTKTTRSPSLHHVDASYNVPTNSQGTLDSADLIAKIDSTANGPFTWTQRFPSTSPPSRQGFAMAYDASRGQAIVFGGDITGVSGASLAGDTWVWDGTGWSQKSPTVSPPARDRPAMSYDAARGQVILFGGRGNGFNFGDTWTWDGSTWTQRTPSQSPPSRYSSSLAYDSARGQVVLFGGFTADPPGGPVSLSNDTWVWDGSTWTQKFPSRRPSSRFAFAMAYEPSRQQIVLFGGVDNTGTLSDTWVWDGSNWTQKTPSINPSARYSASMVYDQNLGQVVLFGGAAANNAPLNDTWAWDGTSWTQIDTSPRPTARFSGGLTRDDTRGQLILFGGSSNAFDFDHLLNDTWVSTIATPTCTSIPPSLVGWWPGNGNTNDVVNGNNGILRGGAAFGIGKVEQGFSLDGVDDLVEIPDSALLRPDQISIEAWVKFDSLDSANTARAGLQYIIFKRGPNAGRFEGYTLVKDRVAGTDNFNFVITPAGGTQTSVRSTTTIAVGQFYHVAATYDRSSMKIYVNGVLENQTPLSLPMEYGDRSIFIGGTDEAAFDGRFIGVIDEPSIYNRSLSASEIQSIYLADAAGKCKPNSIPLLKQDDPAWNTPSDIYDHLDKYSYHCKTMACWGCGTTRG